MEKVFPHLEFPSPSRQEYLLTEIWGDPSVTTNVTPIPPIPVASVPANLLSRHDIDKVGQLWNPSLNSWRPLSDLLPTTPPRRMLTAYSSLIAKLKQLPSSSWPSLKPLHIISTKELRALLQPDRRLVSNRLQRPWDEVQINYQDSSRWSRRWHPKRPMIEDFKLHVANYTL